MTTRTARTPQEKLRVMAAQLEQHQVDAYYVPPEDEHLNEYLPESKQRIRWLTGFTGESAPLLVLPSKMVLFADGRFHIQVDQELDPAVVQASKLGIVEQPTLVDMIETCVEEHTLDRCFRIGYDPFIVTPKRLYALQKALPGQLAIEWCPIHGNLVDAVWSDRPGNGDKKAFVVSEAIAGASVADKLATVRKEMAEVGVTCLPVTRLDEVAWLYNIRGGDIPYNPVLESYAIVTEAEAYLFAPLDKLSAEVETHLKHCEIRLEAYDQYQPRLTDLLKQQAGQVCVLVDKDALTLGTLTTVEPMADVVYQETPIAMQKATKNKAEIEGMKQANEKASRAIIRHLAWATEAFKQGEVLSEVVLRDDLGAKYQEEDAFDDFSFPTIPGVGTNSAIIHYSHANPEQVAQSGDFYLVDSGAHYIGGTTDTTRTMVFGSPTERQKTLYTGVLKAHMACARLVFPKGTKGSQIDAVGRSELWAQGVDFAHGTGHGVGAYLPVHEGPNRISPQCQVGFRPGMVTSIEPGYYEEGWGGIRLENLYYVEEASDKPAFHGRPWYQFVSLTWVPFEKDLIDTSQLTSEEMAWLQAYYAVLLEKMLPALSQEEQAWLQYQCAL